MLPNLDFLIIETYEQLAVVVLVAAGLTLLVAKKLKMSLGALLTIQNQLYLRIKRIKIGHTKKAGGYFLKSDGGLA